MRRRHARVRSIKNDSLKIFATTTTTILGGVIRNLVRHAPDRLIRTALPLNHTERTSWRGCTVKANNLVAFPCLKGKETTSKVGETMAVHVRLTPSAPQRPTIEGINTQATFKFDPNFGFILFALPLATVPTLTCLPSTGTRNPPN